MSARLPLLAAPLFAFLYWPLLRQTIIRDDVGVQRLLATAAVRPFWDVARDLLRACTLAFYYRPLAAPLYWAAHAVFGAGAAPLRLLIVALVLLTSVQLGELARLLTGNRGVGWYCGLVYAFAFLHWDTAAMVSNLPHAAAHWLFWLSAVWLARSRPFGGWRGTLIALLPLTLALGFKEDVIVFPALAAALVWALREKESRPLYLYIAFAAWTTAYLRLRLAQPGGAAAEVAFSFKPLRLLSPRAYLLAYRLELSPWLALPSRATLSGMAGLLRTRAAASIAWLAAVAAGGVAVGLGSLRATEDARDQRVDNARSLVALGLLVSVAALSPYIALGRLVFWNCHHLDLSWAALSLPLGLALYRGGERLSRLRWGRPAFAFLGLLLVAHTAVFFWFPDFRVAPQRRLLSLYHTGQDMRAIEAALGPAGGYEDVLGFWGFDQAENVPVLLETRLRRPLRYVDYARMDQAPASRPPDWLIKRGRDEDRVVLEVTRRGALVSRVTRRMEPPFDALFAD